MAGKSKIIAGLEDAVQYARWRPFTRQGKYCFCSAATGRARN